MIQHKMKSSLKNKSFYLWSVTLEIRELSSLTFLYLISFLSTSSDQTILINLWKFKRYLIFSSFDEFLALILIWVHSQNFTLRSSSMKNKVEQRLTQSISNELWKNAILKTLFIEYKSSKWNSIQWMSLSN
jgi:hypothetical protein